MTINLNAIARELTLDEGLSESISEAQVKEVLGCLGRRWRERPAECALSEAAAIAERAGMRSGKR